MQRFSHSQRVAFLCGPIVAGVGMLLRQDHLLGPSVIADPLQGCLMGLGIGMMIVALVKARRPGRDLTC